MFAGHGRRAQYPPASTIADNARLAADMTEGHRESCKYAASGASPSSSIIGPRTSVQRAQPVEFVAVEQHPSQATFWIRQHLAVVVEYVDVLGQVVIEVRLRIIPLHPDSLLVVPIAEGGKRTHDLLSHRGIFDIAHGECQVDQVSHSDNGMCDIVGSLATEPVNGLPSRPITLPWYRTTT